MAAISSFRRELDVFLDETLSVDGRRQIFVGIAREELAKFESDWRAALPGAQFERFVDGKKDAAIDQVRIDGGVVAERVRALGPVLDRLLELFDIFTKVLTGGYKSETAVFANGSRVGRGVEPAPGSSIEIVNLSPFSRKAEVRSFNDKDDSGFSNGLFESLAAILNAEFRGSSVSVYFGWETFEGRRLPMIALS